MIRMDIRAALLTTCLALGLLTFVNLPSIAESFDGRRAVIVDGDTIPIGSEMYCTPSMGAYNAGISYQSVPKDPQH